MQEGKKTMRNVSKNRFLTCFRPVVDIDAVLESTTVVDRSASRRLACINVGDKHDTKKSTTKGTFSEQELTQKLVVPHRSKRTFSKVIKAVVFETMLNTRVGNKSSQGQNCFGSKRGYSAYTESSSTHDEKKAFVVVTNFKKIKAPELSSPISSSNSPVSESKNIFKSESTKGQVEKQKKLHCVGIYWFLISLAVTVLWGNINVIILTSMLLCFFSCCCQQKEVPKLWNSPSKVYKNSPRDHSGRSNRNKERL